LAVMTAGDPPQTIEGRLKVHRRDFPVQRLTLPTKMVDLNPETERRAVSEADQLRTLYRTVSPERFWRGRFTRPVGGTEPGTGFGSRRVINGQPKAPHTGAVAPTGPAPGPPLHFGAHVGAARIAPATLFELTVTD